MSEDNILSASDSLSRMHAEDAVFIGWQPTGKGKAFPLYTITASGHTYCGSTVSNITLNDLNLQIPETPPFEKLRT